jgi:hypothetical protein
LGDVYGSSSGPQEAEIVVDLGAGEVVVPWKPGTTASETLLQVGVFDSTAAQFYIDNDNQVHFLPFGLALPHKLNELCLTLRRMLEAEQEPIKSQLSLATVCFEAARDTKAQTFFKELSGKTTDTEIETETNLSPEGERRLDELTRLLAANTASAADVNSLSPRGLKIWPRSATASQMHLVTPSSPNTMLSCGTPSMPVRPRD